MQQIPSKLSIFLINYPKEAIWKNEKEFEDWILILCSDLKPKCEISINLYQKFPAKKNISSEQDAWMDYMI